MSSKQEVCRQLSRTQAELEEFITEHALPIGVKVNVNARINQIREERIWLGCGSGLDWSSLGIPEPSDGTIENIKRLAREVDEQIAADAELEVVLATADAVLGLVKDLRA